MADERLTGKPWTIPEIEATVAAYEAMLRRETRGEPYTKAQVVRDLMRLMPDRSRGAIELKLQNISAVRHELDWHWIDGYKPMPHYQRALRDSVVAHGGRQARISEALADYGESAVIGASPGPRATRDVIVPPPSGSSRPSRHRTSVALTGGRSQALHDFRLQRLGAAGEEWVVDLEREQLKRLGRTDLAARVRWVSREDGDGAGYDVASFDDRGAERLIEVKTTNYGPLTPFHITRWEVEVSRRNPEAFALYRVHGFSRDPRIYILDGSVEERARLEPSVFLGIPI